MIKHFSYPEGERIETGAIQFGNGDWPGIFIRGDEALHYGHILQQYLHNINNPIDQAVVEGLIDLLNSCYV